MPGVSTHGVKKGWGGHGKAPKRLGADSCRWQKCAKHICRTVKWQWS